MIGIIFLNEHHNDETGEVQILQFFFAFVGQRQGGVLGILQQALSRSSDHIWFERSEANDRKQVSTRLKEHVENPNKLPILIFPEGTCINNTSVMLFKKGSFEVGFYFCMNCLSPTGYNLCSGVHDDLPNRNQIRQSAGRSVLEQS
jgi:hypothetical protein